MAVFQLDGDGNDLADPANVRYFLMSSLPHGGGVPSTGPGICQQNRNPLVANPVLRALLVDLDQWVSAGADPPASKLPRVADGTLVRPEPCRYWSEAASRNRVRGVGMSLSAPRMLFQIASLKV